MAARWFPITPAGQPSEEHVAQVRARAAGYRAEAEAEVRAAVARGEIHAADAEAVAEEFFRRSIRHAEVALPTFPPTLAETVGVMRARGLLRSPGSGITPPPWGLLAFGALLVVGLAVAASDAG